MGKSLKARFNGHSDEVIAYAKNFGILEAMDSFGVKDLIAMENFLKQSAPTQNFSMVGTHNPDDFGKPNAFDKLLEAMLRKYETLNALAKNKDAEILRLKRELDYCRSIRQQEASGAVQAILRECEA